MSQFLPLPNEHISQFMIMYLTSSKYSTTIISYFILEQYMFSLFINLPQIKKQIFPCKYATDSQNVNWEHSVHLQFLKLVIPLEMRQAHIIHLLQRVIFLSPSLPFSFFLFNLLFPLLCLPLPLPLLLLLFLPLSVNTLLGIGLYLQKCEMISIFI